MGESSSNEAHPSEIILARWTERFVAWLIDFVIVSIGLAILFALLSIPFWFYYSAEDVEGESRGPQPSHYLISSLVFFLYWTYFESTTGQSLGKKVMNLKTTNLDGKVAEGKKVALAAFGKAFLLPFDVILGWIFTNERRQRIFNRVSNTLVIKIKKESGSPDRNIRYVKD
ncbi:MAG: RDD family protein [Nitrososphaeraceae archaeon]